MIFNNIVNFILVLLIYNISRPGQTSELSLPLSAGILFLTWAAFAGYCRLRFRKILSVTTNRFGDNSRFTGNYLGLVSRLSILAVFFFALAVYLFSLKHWVQDVPGVERFSVLGGLFALSVYLFYLSTIWYFAYPLYVSIFRTEIGRWSYIRSNLKLNLPILFPWMVLSLAYDLVAFTPWSGPSGFLNTIEGETLFFSAFLGLLMVFMPVFIQRWWGCRPLRGSEKAQGLRAFLREKEFKYRNLLTWPIFEGKMMTAGIMGIVPRYRYILVTDSLLEVLSQEELKAVLAHEIGHAKYRHLLLYVLFFVGYLVVSFGLFDLSFYLLAVHPAFYSLLNQEGFGVNLFYVALAVPMMATLYVYFRYLMGFFMRHFERQADLYSASVMGTPRHTISSLEKIAYLSGKSRNVPSWHHFSVRERVEYLWRSVSEPGLFKKHNRFILVALIVYLLAMGGTTYFVNFSPLRHQLTYSFAARALNEAVKREPGNAQLYENLAMVYQEMGENGKAIDAYEKVIRLDPKRAVALNNLAWLLVTGPDKRLKAEARGLSLAKQAVAVERSPVFLDTLAEAYYANGDVSRAVKTIRQAISLAGRDRSYYEGQLRKFLAPRR